MRRKLSLTLIILVMLIQILGNSIPAYADHPTTWSAGTVTGLSGAGTQETPYKISSEEELAWFADHATDIGTCYVVLTKDLDLGAHLWIPIEAFSGYFNGNGHVISNMTATGMGESAPVGLFSALNAGGTITRLGLENINLSSGTGAFGIGGIVRNNSGTISNCYVTGTIVVTNKSSYIGGVVAMNGGSISFCYSNVTITDTDAPYTTAPSQMRFGGITGYSSGSVNDCFALGICPIPNAVYMNSYHGAVVGNWSDGTIDHCYYTQGTTAVGGSIAATTDTSTIANAMTLLGEGATENDMYALFKTTAFFLNVDVTYGNPWSSSWDFYDTWELDEGDGYPLLIPSKEDSGGDDTWLDMADTDFEGTGDIDDPYEISTAAQLAGLAKQVNSGEDYDGTYFTLTGEMGDEIDLSEHEWVPIGNAENNFAGHFDGNGVTISGMHIGTEGAPNDTIGYAGLFGNTDVDSGIYDVTLTDASIYSAYAATEGNPDGNYIGLLVGYAQGEVDGCDVNGTIVCGDADYSSISAGGLVGCSDGAEINNSTADVAVSARNGDSGTALGGLIGFLSNGAAYDCSSTGNVIIGTMSNYAYGYAGGFVGLNYGSIWNSYATGALTGGDATDLGGFVGYIGGGEIDNCYARGNIEGNNEAGVGGFVGYAYEGYIQNSYATGDTTGGNDSDVGGFNGDYDDSSIWDCYYNKNAIQVKNGIEAEPAGSDEGIGMSEADMKADSFAEILNENVADIERKDVEWSNHMNFSGWLRNVGINNGYPHFSGKPIFTGFNPLSNKVEGNYVIKFVESTETGDRFGIESGNIALTAGITTVGTFLDGVVFDPEDTEYKLFSADQLDGLMGKNIEEIYDNFAEAEAELNTDTLDETTYLMAFNSAHTRFAVYTIQASVSDISVPDAPTGVSATAGNGQATVSFTASVNNGGSAITGYTVTSSPGNITATGINSPITVTGLTNGTAYTFTVTASNVSWTSAPSTASNTVTPSGGGGGGSSTPSTPSNQGTVVVIVNGQTQNAGKETTTTQEGKTIVTVEVDNKVIEGKIDEAIKNNTTGTGNVIQVPVTDTKSDVAKVELTGDIVKKLETNTFDVSVKRDNIEYIIPAEEFTISKVAESLGVPEKDLGNIKVEVQITKLDQKVVEKYNEVAKANGAELVFPPVAFEVVAKTTKADGTTGNVEISKFSNYVERVMEIPAGVDPNKITTGIVFNPDGTYSHVPTEVFQKDGKWYARLNSLTNSNYSVIWNPVTVKSVEKHWSKDAVNDMASRLVIFNAETFSPDKAITRADFAEYIVRALGLYREGSRHENKFSDVSATGDRTLAILIANEYGIVAGYPDGTFRPDALITREEAMAMYQRAMKISKLVGTDNNRYESYTDYKQVGNWAKSYVQAVLSAHVFNGTTATTISPKANLTYAEAAQAIKNLLVESKLINK